MQQNLPRLILYRPCHHLSYIIIQAQQRVQTITIIISSECSQALLQTPALSPPAVSKIIIPVVLTILVLLVFHGGTHCIEYGIDNKHSYENLENAETTKTKPNREEWHYATITIATDEWGSHQRPAIPTTIPVPAKPWAYKKHTVLMQRNSARETVDGRLFVSEGQPFQTETVLTESTGVTKAASAGPKLFCHLLPLCPMPSWRTFYGAIFHSKLQREDTASPNKRTAILLQVLRAYKHCW